MHTGLKDNLREKKIFDKLSTFIQSRQPAAPRRRSKANVEKSAEAAAAQTASNKYRKLASNQAAQAAIQAMSGHSSGSQTSVCVWKGQEDEWSDIDESKADSVAPIACSQDEYIRGVAFHMSQDSLVPDAQTVLCCKVPAGKAQCYTAMCRGTLGIQNSDGPLKMDLDCCENHTDTESASSYSKLLDAGDNISHELTCVDSTHPHMTKYTLSRDSSFSPLSLTIHCSK